MLKGSTKIQLFDAKTGKLTDEVEKHNLVTNAVRNLMSDIVRDWINSYNGNYGSFPLGHVCENSKMISHGDFIYNFYGGLLVFSSKIAESVEHTFPTVDEAVTQIGHAGLGSAATGDTDAGSFNSAESFRDEKNKKYQFVWDFGTSACNGDIASICLTSAACGQAGYFKSGAYNEYNYGVNIVKNSYPNAPYTKRFYPGEKSMNSASYQAVPLDTIGIGSMINGYNEFSVDISSDIKGYTLLSPHYNKGYYYAIYYKTSDNNNIYDFRCFDYDRKTYHDFTVNAKDFVTALKNTSGIKSSWKNDSGGDIFWQGTYYYGLDVYIDDEKMEIYLGNIHSSKRYPVLVLAKLRVSDGSYVTNEITIPNAWSGGGTKNDASLRFADMLDATVVMCADEYTDYESMRGTSIPVLLTDTLEIRRPYCMYNFHPYAENTEKFSGSPARKNMHGYRAYASKYPFYDMYYLATINNQLNILTKTSDKTMKIIYTITEE